jgi:YXWGXW repeat-containing protein
MTCGRILACSLGCSALLWIGSWPSTPARAQVLERGIEGAAVGAIIGGIVGGGKGAGTGAGIGAGIGALSGAAEANARAEGYYGPPPDYGPPPPGYYGPPSYGARRHYGAPNPAYPAPPRRAAIAASISIPPPPLPVYDQPICPGPGYVWTPGHWAYAAGYYWVPGTWVLPPAVGLVWTPGYWGYEGQRYIWHAGYWGAHVGYYGGINYGLGYFGSGYEGGYWKDGVFFYNTAITSVDTAVITNTYKQVVSTATVNKVSFNGPGGIAAQPTAQEITWSRERHIQPTALQVKHQRIASANRALFAAVNHGTPTIAATAKPGVFKGPVIVGPKASIAAADATVSTGSTVPENKTPLPQSQGGTAPGTSEGAGPSVGQQIPAKPHGPSAAATGAATSNIAKHALNGASGPGDTNEGPQANPTAPNANSVLPLATSSISGDKPLSMASSAASAETSESSMKPSTPTSVGAAGSGAPTQTANLEPTIKIPPGTTRFGIEIGTVEKEAGLQPLWRNILTKHPALVAGLQPRRMLAPDKKWQLIAGPFGSTAEASQVCGLFKKQNLKCEATVFAGDEL